MSNQPLTAEERDTLLKLARSAIELAVSGMQPPEIELSAYSAALQAPGASFVTLSIGGALRGCIGTLQAYQPLVQDVCEHAVAAALEDYRFHPVGAQEVPRLMIEISRLTPAEWIEYASPDDLLTKLRPGVDGVIIRDGYQRATYLPQVWEKIADKAEFLDSLCKKMGVPAQTWRKKKLEVGIYQVEEFHE